MSVILLRKLFDCHAIMFGYRPNPVFFGHNFSIFSIVRMALNGLDQCCILHGNACCVEYELGSMDILNDNFRIKM